MADTDLLNDHVTGLIDLLPKDKSGFDIQRIFFLLTIDSATHFLFGESVGALNSDSSKGSILDSSAVGGAAGFAEEFNRSQDYLATRSILQGLYWLINPKDFQEANRKVHEVVDHYVNLALQARKSPSKELSGERYIFLNALAAETQDPKMLRDSMLNILLAGRDTTASLLSSTFYYLARHPETWKKLRNEIVNVFGDSRQPLAEITQSKLREIPYLRHVLNEGKNTKFPFPPSCFIVTPDSFASTASCARQFPRRQQRYNSPSGRRARRLSSSIYSKRAHSDIQCIQHAPTKRLLGRGFTSVPSGAMGGER